jgi:phospho-N-acetylmuramoyl-pentapeptide-transferase
MGGLMILSGIFVATLLWADLRSLYVWAVLFVTLGFGAIGFYDDFLKVTKSSTKGFSGKIRLLAEFIIAGAAVAIFMWIGEKPFPPRWPFPSSRTCLSLRLFFIFVGMFVVVGAGNAVNLTDGLDGLAIVPVMIAAASFGLIVYLVGNFNFSNYLEFTS